MIERIDGMPTGTVGLRASGKLSKEDYIRVLEPALREGVESGELRLLFVLADFGGLEASAAAEDFKTGLLAWFRDHSAWKRFALVTDVEWVAKSDAYVHLAHPWRGADPRPRRARGGERCVAQ